MNLSDFGPYVLPYVIDCPSPVMQHHARLAAIEFCRRTLCWTRSLEPVQIFGGSVVELEPESNSQIIKIKSVQVVGQDWPIVEAGEGDRLVASGVSQNFCYTDDGITLNVYPIQQDGAIVSVRASLAPSLKTNTLNSALDEFIEDISNGVISRIMRIPNQEFTDMSGSQLHEAMFRDRIKTVAMKTSRGIASAFIHGKPRFF